MRVSSVVVAICAFFLEATAFAAGAVVESVQYPAWLERGGLTVPLVPGTALQGKDRLRTGGEARARVRFADGSSVKLGENARFEFEKVRHAGFLDASLRVAAGAFRYATEGLGLSPRRSVTIRARNVTVGIRGTDIWGKSTDELELVCLIEGTITVGAEGHPTLTLDRPLDLYQLPRGAGPDVSKVDPKQLAEWALETEMSKDGPVAQVGGRWRVTAATLAGRDESLALRRGLRERGFPAQLAGKAAGPYSIVIAGLAGEEEARALARGIASVPGVTSPSVGN